MAEEELRKSIAQEPNDFVAHAYLALALSHQKRVKEGLQEADRSIALAPQHAYPHFVKSTIFGRNAKLKEALASIGEAIRLNPNEADYFQYLSEIHFASKDWTKALAAAEKGLSLDPEDVDCQNARAQALIKLNRREEASQTLSKALSASPDKAETHAQKGFLLLEGGKYDEAAKAFEESLRLQPLGKKARLGLARALKARYPFYSWFLKYFLWTEKMGGRVRGGLTLGTYVVIRSLAALAKTDPHLSPWVGPFIALYIFFVAGTWLSDHLFNMVLCLTPAGRAVLGEDKVLKYKWFGGILLLSIAFFAATYFTLEVNFVFGGIGSLFLVIPLASVFQIPEGKYRKWMWAWTALTAFCGAAALAITVVAHPSSSSNLSDLAFLFAFAFFSGILVSRLPGRYLTRKASEG